MYEKVLVVSNPLELFLEFEVVQYLCLLTDNPKHANFLLAWSRGVQNRATIALFAFLSVKCFVSWCLILYANLLQAELARDKVFRKFNELKTHLR